MSSTITRITDQVLKLLHARGQEYDQPQGERSMARAVKAFNAITGRDLTEAEGWLLLQILKDVRQWTNPSRTHEDSLFDCIAYAMLKAESLLKPITTKEDNNG